MSYNVSVNHVNDERRKTIVTFRTAEVMAASIQSLLAEISGVEDPVEELQCLKTALLSIPVSALRDCVRGQRFDAIFSLLNSNDRSARRASTCCDVLSQCLSLLSLDEQDLSSLSVPVRSRIA